MAKGTKIVLIIAAVCIALSVILFGAGAIIGGIRFSDDIETEIFGVNVHMGKDGIFAGPAAEIEGTGYENTAEFTENIDAIEVYWVSDFVNFEFGGENITVRESSNAIIDDEDAMMCTVENGTLKIHYYAPRVNIISLGDIDSKNLTVTIPQNLVPEIKNIELDVTSADMTLGGFDLKNLKISSTSGNATVSDIKAENLIFDATSGDFAAENCELSRFSVQTTSGSAYLTDIAADHAGFDVISGDVTAENCAFGKVEAESTSGSFSMSLNAVPTEFDAETTSGNVELFIPEDSEFTLEFDPTSGVLELDFAAVMRDDKYIVGSGRNEINIETTSGDAYIRIK